ncbi:MAG TPA: DUF6390 family protein [Acidimicrobiia bacterium]|nr:DUF6390 family protein [Acidimicrobiia bacterium]
MRAMSGSALFCRFAFPPNSLGYCGPADSGLLKELMIGGDSAIQEVRHVIPAFTGAWPYLELIAACSDREPLDPKVVEAYWLGSPLLEKVDLLDMGNSLQERFRRRAGWDWKLVSDALNAGGRPTHSFHVFCVYPWVGLLQSGIVDQALAVLDRCRIRWGEVVGRAGDRLLVDSQPLAWDGARLGLSAARVESVLPPVDHGDIEVGDLVAMHWDYVCQKITPGQHRDLRRYQSRHLTIADRSRSALGARIER